MVMTGPIGLFEIIFFDKSHFSDPSSIPIIWAGAGRDG